MILDKKPISAGTWKSDKISKGKTYEFDSGEPVGAFIKIDDSVLNVKVGIPSLEL